MTPHWKGNRIYFQNMKKKFSKWCQKSIMAAKAAKFFKKSVFFCIIGQIAVKWRAKWEIQLTRIKENFLPEKQKKSKFVSIFYLKIFIGKALEYTFKIWKKKFFRMVPKIHNGGKSCENFQKEWFFFVKLSTILKKKRKPKQQ